MNKSGTLVRGARSTNTDSKPCTGQAQSPVVSADTSSKFLYPLHLTVPAVVCGCIVNGAKVPLYIDTSVLVGNSSQKPSNSLV